LIGRGHLKKKWKDYTAGMSSKTFRKEAEHSAKNGVLSQAVRKLMGKGMDWNDTCEEEEGLVVGELGRRMVAEEWSMGEESLV